MPNSWPGPPCFVLLIATGMLPTVLHPSAFLHSGQEVLAFHAGPAPLSEVKKAVGPFPISKVIKTAAVNLHLPCAMCIHSTFYFLTAQGS